MLLYIISINKPFVVIRQFSQVGLEKIEKFMYNIKRVNGNIIEKRKKNEDFNSRR